MFKLEILVRKDMTRMTLSKLLEEKFATKKAYDRLGTLKLGEIKNIA